MTSWPFSYPWRIHGAPTPRPSFPNGSTSYTSTFDPDNDPETTFDYYLHNYYKDEVTLSSNPTLKTAKVYVITATPKSNYAWSDTKDRQAVTLTLTLVGEGSSSSRTPVKNAQGYKFTNMLDNPLYLNVNGSQNWITIAALNVQGEAVPTIEIRTNDSGATFDYKVEPYGDVYEYICRIKVLRFGAVIANGALVIDVKIPDTETYTGTTETIRTTVMHTSE